MVSCVFSFVGSGKIELASGGNKVASGGNKVASGGASRNPKGALFYVPDVMAVHGGPGLALLRSLFPG